MISYAFYGPPSSRSQKAVTITETVMVLALAGALVVMIGSLIRDAMGGWDALGAARKLGAEVRRTSERARAEQVPWRIRLLLGQREVLVERASGSGWQSIEKLLLSDGVTVSQTSFTYSWVAFDRRGLPSEGGTVTLGDSGGRTASVTVLPGIGNVSVTDG